MRKVALLLITVVTLSACAAPTELEAFSDGRCTATDSQLIEDHITGQINAMSSDDWEKAYSFAAPGFRESVSLEEFTAVIILQYQMLINNQKVSFGDCEILNSQITQKVSVTSDNQIFDLIYSLSVIDGKLGVEAAVTSVAATKVNT
ncbi:MAG: hypothetical protein RIS05_850 [Actinomycetota bacterium]|jgi:hypothetical protein